MSSISLSISSSLSPLHAAMALLATLLVLLMSAHFLGKSHSHGGPRRVLMREAASNTDAAPPAGAGTGDVPPATSAPCREAASAGPVLDALGGPAPRVAHQPEVPGPQRRLQRGHAPPWVRVLRSPHLRLRGSRQSRAGAARRVRVTVARRGAGVAGSGVPPPHGFPLGVMFCCFCDD